MTTIRTQMLFNFSIGSVYLSEPLAKISDKSVRPNLWNEKVPFNNILSDRFFLFFIIGQSIRLSIYVSGHLTEVLLKMITSLYYKNCAANAFSSLRDHWNDMANICLLAQFSRVKQLYTQQCTFEFKKLSISTVLNFCKSANYTRG